MMVNMKLEKKEEVKEAVLSEQPEYPYGLQITLDDCCLDKLGIKELPELGKVMNLNAKVEVTSVSENQREGEESLRSIGIQITDMELSDIKERKSDEEVLYGEGKQGNQ